MVGSPGLLLDGSSATDIGAMFAGGCQDAGAPYSVTRKGFAVVWRTRDQSIDLVIVVPPKNAPRYTSTPQTSTAALWASPPATVNRSSSTKPVVISFCPPLAASPARTAVAIW